MTDYQAIIEKLGFASFAANIRNINDFYVSTVPEFSFFQEKYNIHCPGGCGECCRHFVPDVTKLEALEVASYVRFCMPSWKEVQSRLEIFKDNDFNYCPFFRENTVYHCSVYEARPLICRLFGNSCSADKQGNAVFRRCKYNYQPEIMTDSLCITDRDEASCVPVMDKYAIQMMNLKGNSQDVSLLPEAVLRELDRLNYYIELLNINVDDFSPSNPDDSNFPSPQAS